MTNRHKPAKPILSSKGFPSHDSVLDKHSCTGLTKLEYAAIQIASGMFSDGVAPSTIIQWSRIYANRLFDELEKQENKS